MESNPPQHGWTWGGNVGNGGNAEKEETEDGPSRKKMKIQSNHNTKSNESESTQSLGAKVVTQQIPPQSVVKEEAKNVIHEINESKKKKETKITKEKEHG